MKTTLLKISAIVFCLLLGLLIVGTDTKAADTEPDTENCWYAGIVVYCHSYYTSPTDGSQPQLVLGPSVGWNEGGGNSSESCNVALNALMVEAAHAGCLIQEGSPHCYQSGGACKETVDPVDF